MWQYPIGTVVRFIQTEDQPRALWGHVVGFRTDAQGQVLLQVEWETGGVGRVLPSEVEVHP